MESPGKVIFPCRHFDQVKRVEKSPYAKQFYPCQEPTPLSFRGFEKPEESPGKVIFPCRHFDQVKRVEKSPKAKRYFVVKKDLPP